MKKRPTMTDEAEKPTYDWRHFASLVPGADPDSLNRKLNAIYEQALRAHIIEQDPDADGKVSKKEVAQLYKIYAVMTSPARRAINSYLLQLLSSANVSFPGDFNYRDLDARVERAINMALAHNFNRASGSRGRGAQVRLAFASLIELYCTETGDGKPYRRNKKLYRLQSAEFAVEVMRVWHLLQPADNPTNLAAAWVKTPVTPNPDKNRPD